LDGGGAQAPLFGGWERTRVIWERIRVTQNPKAYIHIYIYKREKMGRMFNEHLLASAILTQARLVKGPHSEMTSK